MAEAPETPQATAEPTPPETPAPTESAQSEAPAAPGAGDNANRTMGDLIETLPPPPSGSETSPSRPERHAKRARKAEPAPEVELPALTPAPPQPERTAQAPQAERQAPAKPAAEPAQPAETRAPERPPRTPPQTRTQAPKPAPNRVAALNPPSAPVETRNAYSAVSLAFGAGSDVLSAQATQMLTHFARRVADTQDRIEIRAYAAAPGDDFGAARRLSLKRALAVRGVLMREGIRSTRMDVRALGGSQSGGDPDRVDLTLERGNAYRPPSGGPGSGG
jgi:outer membrane protein OmpA-like peptidoglycan-associated protein